MQKKIATTKIVIVGAGLAGLAACARLIELGYDAMILEARDRIGGRVWNEMTSGVLLSRGASWIHGVDNNPMALLAKQHDLEVVPCDFSQAVVFDQQGRPIPGDEVYHFEMKFDALLRKAKTLARQSPQDMSLSEAIAAVTKNVPFSTHELDLLNLKQLYFEGYMGAGSESLSARHWDLEETWPGDNCYLTSTYQPIVDALAAKCKIELNRLVTDISYDGARVRLVANHQDYEADAVIVTVPLGVLKRQCINFNPPLPPEKVKAIQRVGMGLLNITALTFKEVFWPKEALALFSPQIEHRSISVFINYFKFSGQPVLLGYSGGARAAYLEGLSDSALVRDAMLNLEKSLGMTLPQPVAYSTTRWQQDPFSYGAYSYVAVGASGDDFVALAASVADRLFFAGEATCVKHFATTHGAYLSGIREADKINRLFATAISS